MNQSLTCLDISFTDLNIHIIFECKIDSSFQYIEKNPIHNPSAEEKAPLFFNLLCLIHTLLKEGQGWWHRLVTPHLWVNTGWSLGLAGLPIKPTWQVPRQWETLFPKQWMVPKGQHSSLSPSLHVQMCTHATHQCTLKRTETTTTAEEFKREIWHSGFAWTKPQVSPACFSGDDMEVVGIKGSGVHPRLSPMDILQNPFSLSKAINLNCLYPLILHVLVPNIITKDLPC